MKHEWRKKEKEIYIPKETPQLVKIEKMKYITINGQGNPNSNEFKKCIESLYPIAYAIKMMPKKNIEIENYYEYTVYPLEGVWDLTQKGREEIKVSLNKDELIYKLMIRQPDFVTKEIFDKAVDIVKSKKSDIMLDYVKFEEIEEGYCVQALHIGSYDEEKRTFDKMELFCGENNLKIKTKAHKEIYLSDFRKVEISKLKTVLRYKVEI